MEENSFSFPLVSKELPEKFLKKAELELGETPERREKCLTELRKLILEEKEMICPTDDESLIIFLRARKFDVDRAFTTLKNMFKLKLELDFFLTYQNINKFYNIFEKGSMTFLQYRDPEGRAVLVLKPRYWKVDEETLDDHTAVCTGLLYSTLEFPMTQVNGIVVIMDMKDFSLSHFTHLTPRNIRHMIHGIQDCGPFRLKALHIVKETFIFKYIWMLLKPFLKNKLRNRFFFHGRNMESLHQFIPPSILPPEYGGNLDIPVFGEQCKETKCGEKFLQLVSFGYKEEEEKLRKKLGISEA